MNNRIISVSAVKGALEEIQVALEGIQTDCIGKYRDLANSLDGAWNSTTADTVKEKILTMDSDLGNLKVAIENMKSKIYTVVQSVENVNVTSFNNNSDNNNTHVNEDGSIIDNYRG